MLLRHFKPTFTTTRTTATTTAGAPVGAQVMALLVIVVTADIIYFTQLLFQQNALVFIKSTRYYNLYFLSLYS
jgi:hypothetical protein